LREETREAIGSSTVCVVYSCMCVVLMCDVNVHCTHKALFFFLPPSSPFFLQVLLHGFPDCALTWYQQMPRLAARGYGEKGREETS
jgi:hypothetical protein